MPIGDSYKHLAKNKIRRFLINTLGTDDLHSHIRLRPVINFLKKYMKQKNVFFKIIEIGCGNGVNAFELAKIKNSKFSYVGFDIDKNCINVANELAEKLNIDHYLKFINVDVSKYEFDNNNNSFDIALLVDFLEHVVDPKAILNNLKQKLKKNGIFIVSVPTRNYSKVFGKKFHHMIGHVTEGFGLYELQEIFRDVGAELLYYKYNTGMISNLGCAVYYRIVTKQKLLRILKIALLYPFSYLDIINHSKISSTLFAVFVKK